MTESATQSNTKRHKLHPDRISDLPEPLLCHILSFLPTKQSVATTILSRTWNHLWTLVPNLDLDTTTIDASFNLEPIVSRLLSLQRTPCLQNFRLKFLYGCSSFNNPVSYLETWLRIAAGRKVEELDLDYESIRYTPLQLPPSFFSCTTLVVLKLRGDIHIDPPSSFQFPSLKIMHFINISLGFTYFSLRLISACPVLEELSCEKKYLDGEYKICVLTLKRLSITLREAEFVSKFVAKFVAEIGLFGCEYKLEINAPALEYFNFEGNLCDIKIHEKLDNLVQANVDIWTFEDDKDDGHAESYSDRVFQLLAALNSVKFLSFFFRGTKCLLNDNIYPYLYKNLVRLDFKVNDCSWHVLQGLLQNAPNLEILDVTKSCDFFEHDLGWKQPHDDLDNLLSHLKSLCYRGFEGLESEVEFLKYILKHARVLKTVTIQVSGQELKGNVLEKLSMFPRCSTCLLTVE